MFIDERNQIQFESIEEMAANKEFAIKEILNWEIPTIEELAEEMIKSIEEVLEAGLVSSTEDVINGFKLAEAGYGYAQEIFDNTLQNEEVSAKMKTYFRRCVEAAEFVIENLKN